MTKPFDTCQRLHSASTTQSLLLQTAVQTNGKQQNESALNIDGEKMLVQIY